MEFFFLLVVLLVAFIVFVLPALVFALLGRVKRLEEQVSFLQEMVKRGAQKKVPTAAKENQEVPRKTPPRVEPAKEFKSPERANPPALPPAAVEEEEKAEPPQPSELPRPAGPVVPQGPSEIEIWLEKIGLKPPRADEEGANPMAWWSTRIGLAFGVIAAVFLGMYVNQDTVPWVRLLELLAVAVGVFAAGCWFERKLEGFGRALSAGGLGLLFVSAYAAYGLPAMKVLESPMTGTLAQVAALALTAGWALWKGREGIFGLALILGYITCSFSAVEGLQQVPLIALLVLSAAGTALFAWRNWWSGLWGAALGSGLGLAVLAIFNWDVSSGPSLPVVLAALLTLTILPLLALCYRWRQGELRAKRVVPMVTSIGLISGAFSFDAREFNFEYFYASFAVLLFVAGWWWRRDEKEGIWQTLWAKAMVLVALFVIAKFGGPVRAFALLGQAGGLVWLARTRARVVFEVGAALAAVVGWYLLWNDIDAKGEWWGSGGIAFLYLVVTQALLVFHRYRLGEDSVRRLAGVFLSTLVAMEVVNVTFWQERQLWLILVPLAFGVLSLLQRWPLKLKDAEWTPFVILLGTLVALADAVHHGVSVTGQAGLWVVCGWGFYAWLGRSEKPRHLIATCVVLLGSLVAIWFVTRGMVGDKWLPLVFAAVAFLWHILGIRFGYSVLRGISMVPGVLAAGILWSQGWSDRFDLMVLLTLLVTLSWWFWAWRYPEEEKIDRKIQEAARTAVVASVLWAFLNTIASGLPLAITLGLVASLVTVGWRFLKAASLAWLALVLFALGAKTLLGEPAHGAYEWVIALYFVLFVAQGIWLAHSHSGELLAHPKAAAVIWGSSAMLLVLVGLVIPDSVASWVTASWALAAVALLASGFWFGLRGYRMIALAGLVATIGRLFSVDIQDSFWRIVAFGVTGALLVGIGYLYNRFHKRLADGDLDWGREAEDAD